MYFGARYYRTVTGRFTSVDPLAEAEIAVGDPQRWNRYVYVGNRPLRLVDPDGRGWATWLFKGARAAAKGGSIAAEFAGVIEDLQTLVGADSTAGERVWALVSLASEAVSPVGLRDAGAAVAAVKRSDSPGTLHHIMTNKNRVSDAAGGPFTPKFEAIAAKAGMSLDDLRNRVRVVGHRGPHPNYNRLVYERLTYALRGLKGRAYREALERELEAIARESATSGSELNRLLTGG